LHPDISPAIAAIGCAHGALAAYLKWKDDPIVQDWIGGKYGPFYKVICKAIDINQFYAIKKWDNNILITESSLNNMCIAIVFKPFIWTKSSIFNELKLYSD
jgi:hypothetical protein